MRASIYTTFFLYCCLATSPLLVDSSCPNDCEPNGKCVDGECECNYGFAGEDCSFPFEQCLDGILTCFNGAQCHRVSLRQDDNESNYECDCSSIPDVSPFQIQECENPESDVCEEGQLQSDYAFCTNGGECIAMIRHGEPHSGCKCNDDFEGRHCQYRKGTAPDVELKLAYAEKRNNVSGVFFFFIVVVALGVIGMFGRTVFKKFQQKKEEEWVEPTIAVTDDDSGDAAENEASKGEMA